MKKILLTVFLSAAAFLSFSQTKSLSVGVKLLSEFDEYFTPIYPGIGGQLVYRITKHSGLETGLYYSNKTTQFYFITTSPSNTYIIEIAERWLLLPVLYRFDSKIINFAAGPQIDYFLGWKNRNSNPSLLVNSYTRESIRVGVTTSLSKTIKLSPTIVLEPETKLTFYPSEEFGILGLNLALRKTIF